jgi:hypothetical protein
MLAELIAYKQCDGSKAAHRDSRVKLITTIATLGAVTAVV